jgi:hypothetical protein
LAGVPGRGDVLRRRRGGVLPGASGSTAQLAGLATDDAGRRAAAREFCERPSAEAARRRGLPRVDRAGQRARGARRSCDAGGGVVRRAAAGCDCGADRGGGCAAAVGAVAADG